MKTDVVKSVGWVLVFLWLSTGTSWAQDVGNYLTITGVVKDKENRKSLENVNVSVYGSNVGTVTNTDGQFSLKIKDKEALRELVASHIGYVNAHISVRPEGLSQVTIWMTPHVNVLNEVVVYPNNPRLIVEEAIKKIPDNYSTRNNLLTAFYRETVQKRRRYIGVSEAVMDVYKTSYADRNADRDKVQILKGRRLVSQKVSDTLAVKVVGGPNLSVYLDLVKNGDVMLNTDDLQNYDFWLEDPVNVDNRMQLVVGFRPRVNMEYALFHGKLYIDRNKLSFTRAELSLDMNDKVKAVQAILQRKPLGLLFKPQEVTFLVTYKEHDGKTYLSYIRNGIRFKCDWKKKLFSSTYTVLTEMVITDRAENVTTGIPYSKSFGPKQVFYDKVDEYWSEDFWGAYNIIEPTESLDNAVSKLKKQPY